MSETKNIIEPPEQVKKKDHLDFKEIMEIYKDVSLSAASRRFYEEFFTPAREALFQAYAHDNSLKINLADDQKVSTTNIILETGSIEIGKSLALACLDNIQGANEALLTFIAGHEIGHFLDNYSSSDKPIGFSLSLKNYGKWFDELKAKVQKKWEEEFKEFHDEKDAGGEIKINPLYYLYHKFFNVLDDCLVNKRATEGFRSLQRNSFNLSDIYEFSLFSEKKYQRSETLLCEQLGYYLIQKVMSPHIEVEVDPLVQEELEKKYLFNGTNQTLLEILGYLTKNYKSNYAAVRYPNQYEKYFIPAFERLLDQEDKEDKEKLKEKLKEITDKIKKEGKKGKGKEGKGSAGEPDPFARRSGKIKEAGKKAEESDKEKINGIKEINEDAGKTDKDKAHDALKKNAARFAKENNLNLNKTQRYYEIVNENVEKIDDFAQMIIALLLRNKTTVQTIVEKGKKAGSLRVPDLIRRYAGIYAGDKNAMWIFERKISIEELKKRILNLKLRLIIDNSGSMAGLMSKLEEVFVIVTKGIRRANELLKTEYKMENINLSSEMILFGNENNAQQIKKAGTVDENDAEFDVKIINGLNAIQCNEGTCDDDAWKLINEKLFVPEEVRVDLETDTESISLNIELTDGFTATPETTKQEKGAAQDKDMQVHCVYLANDQGLDESLYDRTKKLREKLINASKSGNRVEQEGIEKQLQGEAERWRQENQAILKNNPISDIWDEDEYTCIKEPSDIITIIVAQIMQGVNAVDKKLEGAERFNLSAHFLQKE